MPDRTPVPPRHAPPSQNLSDFERQEIRGALLFHFEDCAHPDFDDQALVIETLVERIINRRRYASALVEVL